MRQRVEENCRENSYFRASIIFGLAVNENPVENIGKKLFIFLHRNRKSRRNRVHM